MYFNKNVPTFYTYLTENLFADNWRNYKNDTDLNDSTSSKSSNSVSELLLKSFEIDNIEDLIFTSNGISFGEDYLFFADIVRGLNPVNIRTLTIPGNIVYVTVYDDVNNIRIISVDVISNDDSKFSYFFIKQSDFNSFVSDKTDDTTYNVDDESEESDDFVQDDNYDNDDSEKNK
jgi:hypothetical protein